MKFVFKKMHVEQILFTWNWNYCISLHCVEMHNMTQKHFATEVYLEKGKRTTALLALELIYYHFLNSVNIICSKYILSM